ncbi:DUF3280 domain-containing protein [Noviherbaspirillum sp. Root189]|uniref:DUF3280 domain-containing protein n=1 Tax=Noviherbaspirillum sp. Root189 TaxID=1736487 RepID=UPI00138F3ADC|nr:DUF3280 domain-containing protein [Noviherbaspirillum sp. Root189]
MKTLLMLDFEMIDETGDTSALPAQNARLEIISQQLSNEFHQKQLYTILDRAPVQAMIDEQRSRFKLNDCNGCELDIARALNADRVLTAWVQKVSNLILNLNIEIKDARTGATVLMKSVDIRGNTDQTWTRGINFMVRSMVDKQQGNR